MRIVLDEGAFAPQRAHSTDAGLDLLSLVDVTVMPQSNVVIDTGVHVELPHGTVGMIKSKSGLNVSFGIVSEGVIDEGYTGSIKVKLYNNGIRPFTVMRGNKISQLVVLPCLYPEVEIVDRLEETERGDNGFGSSGK